MITKTSTLTLLSTMTTKYGIIPTNETIIAVINEEFNNTEDIGSEYLYILPFIIIFGVCGNVISLVAILHSRLRRTTANQYLIVLTLADSIFLLALSLIWAKFDYISYETCVLSEYILQTSSYVSSWSISALTIERYMAIAHPLKHIRYSHVNRYKLMLLWIPIPFILNIVQFYVLTAPNKTDINYYEERKCILDNGNLQALTEVLDIIIAYLIPCMIVVVLNLLVASKVVSADKGFMNPKNNVQTTVNIPKSSSTTTTIINSETTNMIPNHIRDSRRQGRPNSSSTGSTRILLVVPVVYILLNTPFYLCRLVDTIAINFFENRDFALHGGMSTGFIYIYNTSYYLYYINFACDVIVYAFSSANFRKTVVIAWKRILCPSLTTTKQELSNAIISKSHHKYSTIKQPLTTNTVNTNIGKTISQQSMKFNYNIGDSV